MDLAALKAEIHANPACSAALDGRDVHALAAIVSSGRTRRRAVPIADIQAQLQSSGAWWTIKSAVANPASIPEAYREEAVKAATAAIDVANARYDNIDMTIPLVNASFSALVSVGLLPSATYDAIIAMSYAPAPVSYRDVAAAIYNDDGSYK
jgi:hypothetical protein